MADALLQVRGKIVNSPALRQQLDQAFRFLDPAKRLVLVTGVPYPSYFAGAQFIHFRLGPAVVALDLQVVLASRLIPSAFRLFQ